MTITPVFLLSLPRSGSTMLQRDLARHPAIATTSEPWFLLGLLPPSHEDQAVTTYEHAVYRTAVEDLFKILPGGGEDWNAAVRGAAHYLYDRLAAAQTSDTVRFFLDKTPRYALASEQIHAVFPEAPMIVLWRNPLAIAASMMSTYNGGRWNLYRFTQDFEIALPRLIDFVATHSENTFCVRYEDVSSGQQTHMAEILKFLGLPAEDGDLPNAAGEVALEGRLGDPTRGLNATAARQGDDRWKAQFQNPLRRFWARRYLQWLGAERLAIMGYDLFELQADLASCRGFGGHLLSDLLLMPRGFLRKLFTTRLVRAQFRRLFSGLPLVDLE